MTTGVVVRADSVPAELTETGASLKLLLDTGTDGPGLVRRLVMVPPGCRLIGTAGAAGELWFVLAGAAGLELDGAAGPELSEDRGLWIPPDAAYDLAAARTGELRLDVVTLPTAGQTVGQAHDPVPDPPGPRARDVAACEVETTGELLRVLGVLHPADSPAAKLPSPITTGEGAGELPAPSLGREPPGQVGL